jgi:hypothetical protein
MISQYTTKSQELSFISFNFYNIDKIKQDLSWELYFIYTTTAFILAVPKKIDNIWIRCDEAWNILRKNTVSNMPESFFRKTSKQW